MQAAKASRAKTGADGHNAKRGPTNYSLCPLPLSGDQRGEGGMARFDRARHGMARSIPGIFKRPSKLNRATHKVHNAKRRRSETIEIINFEPIPHRKTPKPGFWLKYAPFGLREGFKWTRRARRIHLGGVSAQTEPRRPISRPKQSFQCNRFQLGSSREPGNLPSDFRDCFRTTQRVLWLTSIWFLLRTEPWRPV